MTCLQTQNESAADTKPDSGVLKRMPFPTPAEMSASICPCSHLGLTTIHPRACLVSNWSWANRHLLGCTGSAIQAQSCRSEKNHRGEASMTPSVEILVPKSLLGHTNIRRMSAGQGTKNHVCWTKGASTPSPEARLRKRQETGAAQTQKAQLPLLRKEGLAFILRL